MITEAQMVKHLGYDVDEIKLGTTAFLSELVERYTPDNYLSKVDIKLKTSATYMRRQTKNETDKYFMRIGLQNVLGHCIRHHISNATIGGFQEYSRLQKKVYRYSKLGLGTSKRSMYYVNLQAYNAILLHEFAHYLNFVYESGSNHDLGFVVTYNELLEEHDQLDKSILSCLNKLDLLRSEAGDENARKRIFQQCQKWHT